MKMAGKGAEYPILMACAIADLCRRFKIIDGEIDHLTRAINSGGAAIWSSKKPATVSDDQSFLIKLTAAASEIKEDVEKYKTQVDRMHELLLVGVEHLSPISLGQLLAFEQAAFRLKANVIVERIGSLHDRLDQFLERSNPDHPGPTRRRRAEQGVQDKYLNELVSWIYRDLVNFASDNNYLGEGYPYKRAPTTFQFWDYARSSRHHSFLSSRGQSEWAKWYEEERFLGKSSAHQTHAMQPKDSAKFTALRLSYWMPECNELHPIIAHELAHQVLRDIFGYEPGIGDLEMAGQGLARTMRRVHQCVEAWTANSPTESHGEMRPIPIELVCDAFALARCGPSFAYAQFLEFLDNEALADLCKDHNGILEPSILGAKPGGLEWTDRIRQIEFQSKTLRERSVTWILRLFVSTHLVDKLFRPKKGTAEKSLIDELCLFLDDMLELYSIGESMPAKEEARVSQYFKSVRAFAKDLVSAFLTEGALFRKTNYRVSVEEFWSINCLGYRENFFLYRQSLGNSWHDAFGKLLPRCGTALVSDRHLGTMDIPWLFAWRNAKEWTEGVKDKQVAGFGVPQINALDSAREVYIYRTTNPLNVAHALGIELTDESREKLRIIDSENSLSSAEQRALYFEWMDLIEVLQSADKRKRFLEEGFSGRSITANAGEMFKKSYPALKEGGDDKDEGDVKFTFDSSSLEKWYRPDSRYKFHLLSVSSNQKAEVYRNFEINEESSNRLKGVVLGRYDLFEMHKIDSSDNAESLENLPADHLRRTRNIVFVSKHEDRKPPAASQSDHVTSNLAVVLLSMQWTALRLYSIRFVELLAAKFTELKIDVCLSDGWEDLVIFVACRSEAATQNVIRELTEFIEELNVSSFVATTETIFHKSSLPYFENDQQVDVTIQCRMSQCLGGFLKANEFRKYIAEQIAKTEIQGKVDYKIKSQYGILDYCIKVNVGEGGRNTKHFLNILYALEVIDRIETQISV